MCNYFIDLVIRGAARARFAALVCAGDMFFLRDARDADQPIARERHVVVCVAAVCDVAACVAVCVVVCVVASVGVCVACVVAVGDAGSSLLLRALHPQLTNMRD